MEARQDAYGVILCVHRVETALPNAQPLGTMCHSPGPRTTTENPFKDFERRLELQLNISSVTE